MSTPLVVRFVTTPLLADLIAGAGLFIVSLIVLTILTGHRRAVRQRSALSPIDRTSASSSGWRAGCLSSRSPICARFSLPQNDRPAWIREAKSEPFLQRAPICCATALPESLQVKTAGAADDAHPRARPGEDAERAHARLVDPEPARCGEQAGQEPAPGHNRRATRRDMDRSDRVHAIRRNAWNLLEFERVNANMYRAPRGGSPMPHNDPVGRASVRPGPFP